MKTLSFYAKQITIGNRAYQILVPQFLLNHMYVGEFRKNDFMIFSNGHGLKMLASKLVLISRNVDKILYLPIRDNPLTEYLQRWFWDSSNNDLVLYHHSLQFNINEWKEIRENLKGYKDKVTYNINEEEYTEVPQKEYDRFRYRENKDGLHIKRKYETVFFEGSAKVFSIMSGRLIPLSEEKCQLFGDVSGKKMLEIGCGNGQSLQYHGERQASELWGIDISEKQIEKAKQHLTACGLSANLIRSPMEEECGIPEDYFDFVYSIYAIGWTTDLEGTFSRIASYLKKEGVFIFSWSHPIHKCVVEENNRFVLNKRYFDESWYPVSPDFCQGDLTLSDRKLSTYINALAKAGFVIEQMIEETDSEIIQMQDENNNFVKRAKMFPVTFVIKARKL